MKKALALLILATLVGVGLRYAFPKETLFEKAEEEHIDDFLAETLDEVEQEQETFFQPQASLLDSLEFELQQQQKEQEENQKKQPYLANFFNKLHRLETEKKGQLRIAFFGDSMLDADMIVMQFRHYLQKHFGGYGVGFVPITSVSALGRYSIKHSYSANWKKQTFLKKQDTIFAFGVNGETFFVGDSLEQDEATLHLRRGSAYRELVLVNPQLFYGKQRTYDSIEVQKTTAFLLDENGEEVPLELKANRLLNTISLPNGKKELNLTIKDQGTVPFYGVSFASKTGIIVDNLAIRGNSGLTLSRLESNLMRQFQKQFDYDLIILSYGTNVFNPSYKKGFGWYGKRMERVVKHLKKCFGNADVIVMSMADRAVKIDEEMQTPLELADFIEVQKNLAKDTESAFFNLYETMGGAGSMREWAEAEPPMANKDYTHFNSKGAEKVADFLYDWLMKKYANYTAKQMKIAGKKDTILSVNKVQNIATQTRK